MKLANVKQRVKYVIEYNQILLDDDYKPFKYLHVIDCINHSRKDINELLVSLSYDCDKFNITVKPKTLKGE